MKNTIKILVIFIFVSFLSIAVYGEVTLSGSAAAPTDALSLWYRTPATAWMTQGLPIGNGRLGGIIFGGVLQEHIQFNDSTLWEGNSTTYGSYQNFGDMYLAFSGLSAASNYRRDLSLQKGIASVQYDIGSTTYKREYFCSYPDKVMALRLSSNGSANLSFTVSVADAHTGAMTASGNRITMSGKLSLVSYEAQILVLNEGGSLSTASNKITVNSANAVTILLAGCTDYNAASSTYISGTSSLHSVVSGQIDAAAAKSFGTLESNHINDYQGLFNRVTLTLNNTTPTIPTDQLVANYKGGAYNPALEVLLFQYGRYLTIAGSRDTLPTNLQGIWCNTNSPSWSSDYHTDINIQMNYFAADTVNLAECTTPYTDWIYNEAVSHAEWKAKAASLGHPGWTLCTQNNIFGQTNWQVIYSQNAWLAMGLWHHYLYTQDASYLSGKAYPAMKSASDFWISRLKTAADGTLVAPNGYSPEHGTTEDGVSFDQQLIWDLFTNTIKAGEVLNVDVDYRSTLKAKLAQLDPGMHIGSWGQLREWKTTNDSQTDTHRHISMMICLYPGNQLLPLTMPSFAAAAKVSLDARGDGGDGGNGYGWDHSWKMACRARLFDGNHAYTMLRKLFTDGDFASNLFDIYGGYVFQIDANFGVVAGITETILQSHAGFIHLLPALPDTWATGSVRGLVARGNFGINMKWNSKLLTEAVVTSNKGAACIIKNSAFTGNIGVTKVSDGQAVNFSKNGDTITFNTAAGESYKISAGSATPVKGDVNSNGSVDIVDALLIAQYYVGLNPANFNAQVADVNCSGSIDIVDALLIAQRYVGLIPSFPC